MLPVSGVRSGLATVVGGVRAECACYLALSSELYGAVQSRFQVVSDESPEWAQATLDALLSLDLLHKGLMDGRRRQLTPKDANFHIREAISAASRNRSSDKNRLYALLCGILCGNALCLGEPPLALLVLLHTFSIAI